MMGRISLGMLLVAALAGCTQTGTTTGTPDSGNPTGSFRVVKQGDGVDVVMDAQVAPLSVAASVVVEGATAVGTATLGAAAAQHNLFTQKVTGGTLRFAVSDSRGVLLSRAGVVVHIPLQGAASRVEVKDISAANAAGNAMTLGGFAGEPGQP